MVEATEDRHGAEGAHPLPEPRSGSRRRNRLPDPLMRPGLIEVPRILAQHLMQVALAQDEDVVQALTPDTAKEVVPLGRVG
jgi:hypothetical protein